MCTKRTLMRVLELPYLRKGRIWLNELPDASYSSDSVVTHTMPADVRLRPTFSMAAVELRAPAGARSLYGLLGGVYDFDSSGTLTIEIGLSDSDQRKFIGFDDGVDDIRVGLPSEYSSGVVEGIRRTQNRLMDVSGGRLRITCAAHGAIGSSPSTFESLASTLLAIFHLPDRELSDENLRTAFAQQ